MEYFINKIVVIFKSLLTVILFIFFLNNNKGFTRTAEQLIHDSIVNCPENYQCPYYFVSIGKKYLKKSAYSKPEEYQFFCYAKDISDNEKRGSDKHITINVVDGDTIHINNIKHRLYGFDAPEMRQLCKINEMTYQCGIRSKKFLVSVINNKKVKCVRIDIDRYKRIIAGCFTNNTNFNRELVKSYWALAYRGHTLDYVIDEQFSQENSLGIWKGTFIHPKKWRKINR